MVLLIAIVPALLVIVIAAITRSKAATLLGALVAAIVGIETGNPAYTAIDLAAVTGAVVFVWKKTKFKTGTAQEALDRVERKAQREAAQVDFEAKFLRVARSIIYFGITLAAVAIFLHFKTNSNYTPTRTTDANIESIEPITKTYKAQKKYSDALAVLEARHPEINPDSPLFDQLALTALETRYRYNLQVGMTPEQALYQAASDYERLDKPPKIGSRIEYGRPSQKIISNPDSLEQQRDHSNQSQRQSACEYKGVMTDQDYLNCGIKPPKP